MLSTEDRLSVVRGKQRALGLRELSSEREGTGER